jgi:hypothetical protein
MPDPRHMDATQAFDGWPSVALHFSRTLRLEPAAATINLPSLLVSTAPELPNELDKIGIARLLSELQRCGEAVAPDNGAYGAQGRAGSGTLLLRVGVVRAG